MVTYRQLLHYNFINIYIKKTNFPKIVFLINGVVLIHNKSIQIATTIHCNSKALPGKSLFFFFLSSSNAYLL